MFMRIAVVGTLKSVPPMLTGNRAGPCEPSASQVGHNRKATMPIAPAAIAPASRIGTRWLRRSAREIEMKVMNRRSLRRAQGHARDESNANMPCDLALPHGFKRAEFRRRQRFGPTCVNLSL